MNKNDYILITGGTGLVGSALTKVLREAGYSNVRALSSRDVDLTNYEKAVDFIVSEKPRYIFHLAAAVYGIMGNMDNKGTSFLNNTLMNVSVVEGARKAQVEKIVCMGSGCVYPYPSPGLPLREDMVWQGAPHFSENSYAHSKRAMLAMLDAYRESYDLSSAFVISCNLYGSGDKFDPRWGHVTPALIRKFYEACRDGGNVSIWGDGTAERDFLYSEDAAAALVAIMDNVEGAVNMGSGVVSSIRDIVENLTAISGLQGKIEWDSTKPNGQDYRSYDLSRLGSTGFKACISLHDGLQRTWEWYCGHEAEARK